MKFFEIDESTIENPALMQFLKQVDKHTVETNKRLEIMEGKLDNFNTAFPGGDIEGHRSYHQTMIEMLRERRRLRVAIQEKTISGLVWAGIVWAVVAMWQAFISYIK